MTRLLKRVTKKIGQKPGTIIYVGEHREEPVTITIMGYDQDILREKTATTVEECLPFKEPSTVTWIDVTGVHDVHVVEKIGTHFGLHPLIMEDIVNTGHRPKFEEQDGLVFISLKMLFIEPNNGELHAEQVSIIFGKNVVVSFQEKPGDVFTPVRERIRKTVPRVRFLHADYLAYALIDAIVDNYFLVLEHFGEDVEGLEEKLVNDPQTEDLETIHDLKRHLIYMRKAIWPLREAIGAWERLEAEIVHDLTRPYLRDLYEHAIQVIDTVETYRDMVSGLLDIYLSSISNKMNQVMKVLTIIATIFIPLGFLAGVYGMNFDTNAGPWNLPELGLRYGYPLFWLVAVLIGGGLFLFFRRKRWL